MTPQVPKTFILVLIAALLGLGISFLLPSANTRTETPNGPQDPVPDSFSPRRIICMSPSVTELTFALGQGDQVVGISEHTTHPPEALDKPRCGGFVNPNFERIMALKPDLIVTQGLAQDVRTFADEHNMSCLSLDLTDLDSIYTAIKRLGKTFDCPNEARALEQKIRGELQLIRERVKNRPSPQTFIVIGRSPDSLQNLTTIGPGSYLADILKLAGGQNIFHDLSQNYATINKEVLTQRQPQVIIELRGKGMMDNSGRERVRQTWSEMSALPAVKNDRVHVVDKTYALIPGPRLAKLARDIAHKLHPPDGTK